MTFDDTRHAYDTVAADYARLLPRLDAEQQAERAPARAGAFLRPERTLLHAAEQ